MPNLTPREIVHELNKHIVGQEPAKKSVALALRLSLIHISEPTRPY